MRFSLERNREMRTTAEVCTFPDCGVRVYPDELPCGSPQVPAPASLMQDRGTVLTLEYHRSTGTSRRRSHRHASNNVFSRVSMVPVYLAPFSPVNVIVPG